jgi:hypothetical protein
MDIGRTEKQFEHRCQAFARAGDDTRDLLLEYFDMRGDTEHLNPWDDAALRDHFQVEAAIADNRRSTARAVEKARRHRARASFTSTTNGKGDRMHDPTNTTVSGCYQVVSPGRLVDNCTKVRSSSLERIPQTAHECKPGRLQ